MKWPSVLRQNHFDYEDEIVIDVVIMGNENLQHHEGKRHLHEGRFFLMKMVFKAELEGEFAELGGWEAE